MTISNSTKNFAANSGQAVSTLKHRIKLRQTVVAVGVLAATLTSHSVWAAPEGGVVVAGQAQLLQANPQTLNVVQSTDKAIIQWQNFGIAVGEKVNFIQPNARSVVLNRVVGNDPSAILGTMTANGVVMLVNPNGVFFGKGSRVDVGGLVATTANLSDIDFMAGNFNFSQPSLNTAARVVNHGDISIKDAGLAALVAPGVENSGTIRARLGKVSLAGAQTFTLDFHGDGLLTFGAQSLVQNASGIAGGALVNNAGTIQAEGGVVELSARAVKGVVDQVINTSGVISATSVSGQNGRIVLSGGAVGTVAVAGTLDASGTSAEQTGGQVHVSGHSISLAPSALLDASGQHGGGSITIGSEGVRSDAWAPGTVTVARGARLQADALTQGNGGSVLVLADQATRFAGSISAKGGVQSGDGGFAEVSAHQNLAMNGSVDLSAPQGTTGTFLLDPSTLKIIAASSGSLNTNAGDATVNAADADSGDNTISAATLQGIANSANIVLEATGLITVDTSLALQASTGSVTLRSTGTGGGITFTNTTDSISTQGGAITLDAQTVGSSLTRIGNLTSNGGAITLRAGNYIELAGNINAGTGAVALDAAAGSISATGSPVLTGSAVSLSALGGHVGASGAAIGTSTGALTVHTGGNAFVSNNTALTSLNLLANHVQPGTNTYQIAATGLTFNVSDNNGALQLGNVTSTNTAITIGTDYAMQVGVVNAGTANVELTADGTIGSIDLSSLITGGALTVTSRGSNGLNGAIGASSGIPLLTAVNSITATSGSGDLNVANTGALTINRISTTGTKASISSSGNLTVGDVAIVPSSGSSSLTLTSTAGSVLDDGVASTIIKANTLTLSAGSAIGASGSAISSSNATTVTLTAGNGGVFFSTASGAEATFNLVQATSDIQLATTGSMKSTSVAVNGNGNISLTSGGALSYGTLNAGTGNLTLTASGAVETISSFTGALITGSNLTASSTTAAVALTTAVNTVSATAGALGNITIYQASGDLTATSLVALGNMTITANNGKVTLGTLDAGSTGTITVSAKTAIEGSNGNSLKAQGIALTAGSHIASSGTALNTQTAWLSIRNTGSFYIANSNKILNSLTINNSHTGTTANSLVLTSPDMVFTATDDGAKTTLSEVNSTFLTTFLYNSDVTFVLGQLDLENVSDARISTINGSIIDDANLNTRISAKKISFSATDNIGESGNAIGINTTDFAVTTQGNLLIANDGHFNFLTITSTHKDSTANYIYSISGQHLDFAITDVAVNGNTPAYYNITRLIDSGYSSAGGLNYFTFTGDRDMTLGEVNTGAFDYTYTVSGQSATAGNGVKFTTTNGAILDDGVDTTSILSTYIGLEATKGIGGAATNAEIDIAAAKGLAVTAGTGYQITPGSGGIYITAARTIGVGNDANVLTLGNADSMGRSFATVTGDVVFKLLVGDIKYSTSIGSVAGAVTIEATKGSIYNPSQSPIINATTKVTLTAHENIGSGLVAEAIKVKGAEVIANATLGSVNVSNSGVASGGAATFSNVTAGTDVSITQTSGNMVLGNVIANNGSGTISIKNSSGKINDDANASTLIKSATLNLDSSSGSIGYDSRLIVDAAKLNITNTGSISLTSAVALTDVTLDRGGSYSGFDVIGNNTGVNQTLSGSGGTISGVTSGTALNLTFNASNNITISSAVNVGAQGSFTATATGNVTGSGLITAGLVKLAAGSSSSVGTSASKIQVASSKLDLTAGRDIYINSTAALTHVAVTSTNNSASTYSVFSIVGTGGSTIGITDSGTTQTVDVAGSGMIDFSFSNSKNITISEVVATGVVKLSTTGGGVNSNISMGGGGRVSAASLELIAIGTGTGNGSIGSSDKAFATTAGSITIVNNGNIYIDNASTALSKLHITSTHKTSATTDVNLYKFDNIGTGRSVTISDSAGKQTIAMSSGSGTMDFAYSVDRAILTGAIDAGTNTTGAISLTSNGGATNVAGTIDRDSGTLTAGEVILKANTSTGSHVGKSTQIATDTKKLNISSGGSINVKNGNGNTTTLTDLTLNISNKATGTADANTYSYALSSQGLTFAVDDILSSSSITALKLTNINQSGLNLAVTSEKTLRVDSVNVGAGTVALTTTGNSSSVNSEKASSLLTASSLTIKAGSGVGNSTNGVDTFYGAVSTLKIEAGGTIDFKNTGNLALNGVSNRVAAGGDRAIKIETTGNLTQAASSTATIATNALTLKLGTGNIGVSGTPIEINSERLALQTTNNVYLNNLADLYAFDWTNSSIATTTAYSLTGKNLTASLASGGISGAVVVNDFTDASGLDFSLQAIRGINFVTINAQQGRNLKLASDYSSGYEVRPKSNSGLTNLLTAGKIQLESYDVGQVAGSPMAATNLTINTNALALEIKTAHNAHIINQVDLQSLSITSTQSTTGDTAPTFGIAAPNLTLSIADSGTAQVAVTDTTGLDFTFNTKRPQKLGVIDLTRTGTAVLSSSEGSILGSTSASNLLTAAKVTLSGSALGSSTDILRLSVPELTLTTKGDLYLDSARHIEKLKLTNTSTVDSTFAIAGKLLDGNAGMSIAANHLHASGTTFTSLTDTSGLDFDFTNNKLTTINTAVTVGKANLLTITSSPGIVQANTSASMLAGYSVLTATGGSVGQAINTGGGLLNLTTSVAKITGSAGAHIDFKQKTQLTGSSVGGTSTFTVSAGDLELTNGTDTSAINVNGAATTFNVNGAFFGGGISNTGGLSITAGGAVGTNTSTGAITTSANSGGATTLTVSAGGGVYLTEAYALTLSSLTATGDVVLKNGNISTTKDFTLAGALTAAGKSVTIDVAGSGSIVSTTASAINASSLKLVAQGGVIGAATSSNTKINTTATKLDVNSLSNIHVVSTSDLTDLTISREKSNNTTTNSSGTLEIGASNLTWFNVLDGANGITFGQVIDTTGLNFSYKSQGNVIINTINVGAGNVNIDVDTKISQTAATLTSTGINKITAGSAVLKTASTSGSGIGSNAAPLGLSVDSLTITSTGSAGAFVLNVSKPLTLQSANSGGELNVITTTGDLQIAGNVASGASSALTLLAAGSLLSNGGTVTVIGASSPITLQAGTGIGTANQPFAVSASGGSTVSATVTGTGGLYLNTGAISGGLTTSVNNGATVINASGALVMAGAQTTQNSAGNDISITVSTGNLTIGTAATAAGISAGMGYGKVVLNSVAGSVLQGNSGSSVSGGGVTLKSTSGVGTSVAAFGVNTRRLVANVVTSSTGAYVKASGSELGIALLATNGGDIKITSTGATTAALGWVSSTSSDGATGKAITLDLSGTSKAYLGNVTAHGSTTAAALALKANAIYDDGLSSTRAVGSAINITGVTAFGTLANPVQTTTAEITGGLSGTGSLYIQNNRSGALALGNAGSALSVANGSLWVSASDAINVVNAMQGTDGADKDVTLSNTTGDITITKLYAGGLLSTASPTSSLAKVTAAGSVLASGANTHIVAGMVSLTATTGSVGLVTDLATGAGTPVKLKVGSISLLSATTTNSVVSVDNSSTLALTLGSTAVALGTGSSAFIKTVGNLDVSAGLSVSNGNLLLESGGTLTLPATGAITLSGALTLKGVTDIMASGGGRTVAINAASLVLSSGSSGGNTTLTTTVGSLNAKLTGADKNLTISNTGALTGLTLEATGNITFTNNVGFTASSVLANGNNRTASLTATTGDLTLASINAGASNGSIVLSAAAGSLLSAPGGATMVGLNLDLTTATGVGSVATPFATTFSKVAARVTGTGGIYLSGTSFALGDLTTNNGDIEVTTTGALTDTNMVNGFTAGGSGNIKLKSTSGSVTLSKGYNNASTATDSSKAGFAVDAATITLAEVNTTGAQSYVGAATLTKDLTSKSTITFTGNLDLAGTDATRTITTTNANVQLTGAVLGNGKGLTILAGTGSVAITGAVSNTAALNITGATIGVNTVATSGAQNYTGVLTLNHGIYSTTHAAFAVNGATNLTADTTIATGSGNVNFAGTIDGANALTINSTGSTTMGAAVGGTTALTSLATNTGGTSSFKSVKTMAVQTYGESTTLDGNYVTDNAVITFSSPVTLAGATLVDAGTVAVNFADKIDGAFGLTVNSTNVTTFSAAVGSGTALTSLTTNAGGTLSLLASVNTNGAQSYGEDVTFSAASYSTNGGNFSVNGATTLASDTSINAGAGNINFVGTVNGAKALTVNSTGATTFSAAVGGIAALTSMTTNVGGSSSLKSVTTTGTQTYGDSVSSDGTYQSTNAAITFSSPVTLVGATTVDSGTAAVNFNGTIDGAQSLAINTTGATTFGAAVGNGTALANLTTNAGGTSSFKSVKTTGAQTYGDNTSTDGNYVTNNAAIIFSSPVTLVGTTTVDSGTAAVSFNGTVDGAFGLTVNSTSAATFSSAVGSGTALASLTTNAGGTLSLLASVNTNGAQSYGEDVTLSAASYSTNGGNFGVNGATTLASDTSINAGAGNINFVGTVNGAKALTVNSSGATTFDSAVGSIAALTSMTTNVGGSSSFKSVTTTGIQTYGDSVSTDGTYQSTNAAITFSSPVTLVGATTVDSGTAAVNFNGTVDGAQSLAINTTGATTFGAAVGNGTALANLTTNAGGTSSLKSVKTTGAQTYGESTTVDGNYVSNNAAITFSSPVTLVGATLVDAGTAAVSFNGTVDGAQSLAINSTGSTTFGAAVGNDTALASLTTNAGGNSSFRSVKTTGVQTYGDSASTDGTYQSTNAAITFSSPVTLVGATMVDAGTAAVSFNGTVDGAQSLVINSTGTTTFGAAVGNGTALANLTTNAGGSSSFKSVKTTGAQTYGDSAITDGNYVTNNASITFSSPVTLVGATSLDAGSAAVNFNGAVDGAQSLAINSTGISTFATTVGGNNALSSIKVAGTASLAGSRMATSGNQEYWGSLELQNDVVLQGDTLSLLAGGNAATAAQQGISIEGNAVLGGNLGVDRALKHLEITGTTRLNGGTSIVQSGLKLAGNVLLASQHSLQKIDGNMVIAGAIDNATNNTPVGLVLQAKGGSLTLLGAVGTNGAIGAFEYSARDGIEMQRLLQATRITQTAAGSESKYMGQITTIGVDGMELTGSGFSFADKVIAQTGAIRINNIATGTQWNDIKFAKDALIESAKGFAQTGEGKLILPSSIKVTLGAIAIDTIAELTEPLATIQTVGDIKMKGLNGLKTDLTMSSGSGRMDIGSAVGEKLLVKSLTVPSASAAGLFGALGGVDGALAASKVQSTLVAPPYFMNTVPWGPVDAISQVAATVVVVPPVPSTPTVTALFNGSVKSTGVTPNVVNAFAAPQVLTMNANPVVIAPVVTAAPVIGQPTVVAPASVVGSVSAGAVPAQDPAANTGVNPDQEKIKP